MRYEGHEKSHVSLGPWGGQNGARWDDGVCNSVRQVVICHGAAIDSIHVEYDKKDSSVWSEKHGGTGGIKTSKVKLNFPDEYLISISGHYGSMVDYGPVLVRSLVLESNKKKYGPFGIQHGTHFSLPRSDGMVVGFHGRSSWHLDSIGVYVKPLVQRNLSNSPNPSQNSQGKEAVSYGPWGGNGGQIFDDGVYTGVREVHITRYGGVASIRVCYDLNGQRVWRNKHGGRGGIRLDKIAFEYPSEILTRISGYYGPTILRGPSVVRSLSFYTNKRKYGPFGDERGIPFSSASNNGIIVGLHGREGWFIDSIGVHVREGAPVTLPRPFPQPPPMHDLRIYKVLGPWGGGGGQPWDDGIVSGIKRIFLSKGQAIYRVQIEYDRNGQSVWSVRHGGGSEASSDTVLTTIN
uniref:Jacalin-related lectin 3 n=1 Tax=Rhizophora mucronata TaxID=61149 RepID=A0A2P2ISF5_RHIMU